MPIPLKNNSCNNTFSVWCQVDKGPTFWECALIDAYKMLIGGEFIAPIASIPCKKNILKKLLINIKNYYCQTKV